MKLNDALPKITVDPETYIVTADGEELRSSPATLLPLAQRYSCSETSPWRKGDGPNSEAGYRDF